MRFSTDGIGWLIFGVLVCFSSTEADGLFAKLSTIALGLVFVAIYVMKQFFEPVSKGWFIAGGMLLAFSIENGYDSATLMALVLGVIFLFIFYTKNKREVDAAMNGELGTASDYYEDEMYDDSYADPVVEEVTEEVTVTTVKPADSQETQEVEFIFKTDTDGTED
jgi:hypothetical protein